MRKQFFVRDKFFSPARQGMRSRHDDRAVRIYTECDLLAAP